MVSDCRKTVPKLFSTTPKTMSCSPMKLQHLSAVGTRGMHLANNSYLLATTELFATLYTHQQSRHSSHALTTSGPGSGSSDESDNVFSFVPNFDFCEK